ncbi:hypothetical protein Vretifemale_18430, partial [Volvox reticuliferus]
GLPGFYYGTPLPGTPLSPTSSGVVSGSPTRGTSGGSGGGGGGGGGGGTRGPSSGVAGGTSNASLQPPSPSRLNPLAQPWATPFMARDSNAPGMMGGVGVGGGTPASVAQGGMHRANGGGVNTGGVDGSATPLGSSANGALNGTGGTTPPPSASVTGSTVTPSSAGQASPAHGNDDNLANDAGEEVALAAVERTLVNRTPKRPVKSSLPSLANAGFAPQRAPTTSTTADSSVAGSEDHRRVAD